MAADKDTDQLGSWADDELVATTKENGGVGADSGLPDDVRFRANVAKLILRRLAQPTAANDPKHPAVFIFQPMPPPSLGQKWPSRRVPMLDNGLTPVSGRVWFIGAGPGSGFYVDCACQDDDELFNRVTGVFSIDARPAIVFDPRLAVPEARYYERGLQDPNCYEVISLFTNAIAYNEVTEVVRAVYENKMVTPEAQLRAGKLWENATKGWPSSEAEHIVHLYVAAGLQGFYPTFEVKHEETGPPGRLDIALYSRDPLDRSKATCHGVIELKVLRSFGSTGAVVSPQYTLDWIMAGVEQAFSYGNPRGALWKALFCFDMRTVDENEQCFNHVRAIAEQLEVLLRRWYLYATSEQYRAALAAAALS